jgi:hypothetical protein
VLTTSTSTRRPALIAQALRQLGDCGGFTRTQKAADHDVAGPFRQNLVLNHNRNLNPRRSGVAFLVLLFR